MWWESNDPARCRCCDRQMPGLPGGPLPAPAFEAAAGRCSYCCSVAEVLQHPDGLAWLLTVAAAVSEDTAVLLPPLDQPEPPALSVYRNTQHENPK